MFGGDDPFDSRCVISMAEKNSMKYLITICFAFAIGYLDAQKEHLEYALIDDTDPTGWLYTSPKAEPGVRGRQYLFEQWKLAKIVLGNGDVKADIFVNYNLENQILEISTQDGIKVVPPGLVKYFHFEDEGMTRTFMHASYANLGCLQMLEGYHELLHDVGDLQLVVCRRMEKKDPMYNEKLGIGDNNIRLVTKEDVWLATGKRCTELKGSGSKREKQLVQVLRNSRIRKIVEKENLNLKRPSDLAKLMAAL